MEALSLLNFRDIGGLPAGDGRRTRRGVLFRSEGPASFLEQHRAELGRLGVRTVCDLRSAVERTAAPNDWCGPECRVLDLDMNTDLRAQGADVWTALREDPSEEKARNAMGTNYRAMPVALQPHLPAIVDAILEHAVPLLIHCTAGKDRTGVAVALFLLLAGVSRDDIRADYVRSDVFRENARITGSVEHGFQKTFGFVPSAGTIAALVGVHDDFLLAALAEVESRWSGVAGYFSASGVGERRQAALVAALTEPDEAGGR